jgi:DNA-binding IscR family transcriptional regulator
LLEYGESAQPLKDVWIALRANIRAVLEHVTLADLAANRLPASVRKIAADPAAWE